MVLGIPNFKKFSLHNNRVLSCFIHFDSLCQLISACAKSQCRWSGRARVLEVIAVGRFVKTAIAIHLWTLHDRYWLTKMPSLGLRCVPKFPWKHCAAFPCWRISLDFDDIVMSCQSSIALSFQVLMSWATMLWLMLVPEPEMWRARTSNSRVPGRLCAQPRSWLVKSELCVPIWCCLQHIWYICASQSALLMHLTDMPVRCWELAWQNEDSRLPRRKRPSPFSPPSPLQGWY